MTKGTDVAVIVDETTFQHVDQPMAWIFRNGNGRSGPSGMTLPNAAAFVVKKIGSGRRSVHCGFAVRVSCVSAINLVSSDSKGWPAATKRCSRMEGAPPPSGQVGSEAEYSLYPQKTLKDLPDRTYLAWVDS